jgi:hypothetical protein
MYADPPDFFPPTTCPEDFEHPGQSRPSGCIMALTMKTLLQTGQVKAALLPSQSSPSESGSIIFTVMSEPSSPVSWCYDSELILAPNFAIRSNLTAGKCHVYRLIFCGFLDFRVVLQHKSAVRSPPSLT